MKRIFCDCCGNEFDYDNLHSQLNGSNMVVSLPLQKGSSSLVQRGASLLVDLRILFEFTNLAHGKHVDVCYDCRCKIVAEKLGLLRSGDLGRNTVRDGA